MDHDKATTGLWLLLSVARYRNVLPRKVSIGLRTRGFSKGATRATAPDGFAITRAVSDVASKLVSSRIFAAVLCLVAFVCFFGVHVPRRHGGMGLGCQAFIKTATSTLTGAPLFEVDCNTQGRERGGYCICEGDLAIPAPKDRWGSYTCNARCRRIDLDQAIPIPDSSSCPSDAPRFFPANSTFEAQAVPARYHAVTDFWERVTEAVTDDDVIVLPPGKRDIDDDFVAKGLRMDYQHVLLARRQWRDFSARAGPYPEGSFSGRGIVVLGGEIQPYLVPALVAVRMIRKSGCRLPIEMWFPADEVVSGPLVGKLKSLNVHIWTFPVPKDLGKGFYMKAAVLLLSSFQEVLFLDADQVPVRDVTALFESPEYRTYGAVLWPDFWDATWAPDAAEVLGVPPDRMPTGSIESGQMLLDKKRVWPAIVSALHFNLHNQLFYPLFTNYMGYGDKETFGMALLAHQLPFHVVQHRIRSLGLVEPSCRWLGCESALKTTTMVQHSPAGDVMFLHTNMPPKWQLLVTTDKALYQRRWQLLQPGLSAPQEEWPSLFTRRSERRYDVEMFIHDILVSLRCDEHVAELHDRYLAARPEKVPRKRLPWVPEGMRLLQFYEQTQLSGSFLQDQSPTLLQRLHHWWASRSVGKRYLREDTIAHPRHSFTLTRRRLWEQLQARKLGHGHRLLEP